MVPVWAWAALTLYLLLCLQVEGGSGELERLRPHLVTLPVGKPMAPPLITGGDT